MEEGRRSHCGNVGNMAFTTNEQRRLKKIIVGACPVVSPGFGPCDCTEGNGIDRRLDGAICNYCFHSLEMHSDYGKYSAASESIQKCILIVY